MVRNVYYQKNDCGVGWSQQPTPLGSMILWKGPLWMAILATQIIQAI